MAKVWNQLFHTLLIHSFCNAITLINSLQNHVTTPPLPILPLPTYSQLKWQQREIIMFFHFGVNTFTDTEWGSGHEPPSVFNPTRLDTNQWLSVANKAGISLAILTAKHHDGFCLWPSRYTAHSVVGSPWKGGHGDVVQEFVTSASVHGVDVGLYLSPWDRHDPRYGHEKEYNEYYLAQLQELLRRYGNVSEIWFDGAKGANAPNMSYYFWDWFAMVKEMQSSINIFSDAGPDIRWVGNEKGFAGTTSWATINRTSLSIGNASIVEYLNTGDPQGTDWLPPECDVSIRPGWFWHKNETAKSLSNLLEIYYNSVGRNCVLLLNVPPNSSGLVSEGDIQRLIEFRTALNTIFSHNLAQNCLVKASSRRGGHGSDFGPENVLDQDHLWTYWVPHDDDPKAQWIEITTRGESLKFNVIMIQEAIGLGQRIKQHEVYIDGKLVVSGTTIGYKRLHWLGYLGKEVFAKKVQIKIIESRGLPLISSVGLFYDPYRHLVGIQNSVESRNGGVR
ncbi:hypothetical protein vseg_011829 [Gypsophila vaccaria]